MNNKYFGIAAAIAVAAIIATAGVSQMAYAAGGAGGRGLGQVGTFASGPPFNVQGAAAAGGGGGGGGGGGSSTTFGGNGGNGGNGFVSGSFAPGQADTPAGGGGGGGGGGPVGGGRRCRRWRCINGRSRRFITNSQSNVQHEWWDDYRVGLWRKWWCCRPWRRRRRRWRCHIGFNLYPR